MIEIILVSIMGIILATVEGSLIYMIYKLRKEVVLLTNKLGQMIEKMFGQIQEIKEEGNKSWIQKILKK